MANDKLKENLVFDYHTIRLLIGSIALLFPWAVSFLASGITPSISWSYHTNARDVFVGFLFVIGAFLVSYKGHKPILQQDEVRDFWKWLSRFWKGASGFRSQSNFYAAFRDVAGTSPGQYRERPD